MAKKAAPARKAQAKKAPAKKIAKKAALPVEVPFADVSGESFLVPPGEVSDILATAIKRVTGRTPELTTAGGTSDARFIHHYCPLAEFGLVGLTMHKVDERVPLADIAALTDIYAAFLELYFPAR